MKTREQGAALITALVVVAIVATLVGAIALGQDIWWRETMNLRELAQARAVTRGVMVLAASLLDQEGANTSDDDLRARWAQPLPTYPVAGGTVTATVEDAEGRFNLNNLFHQGSPDVAQMAVFQRLLTQAGAEPGVATSLMAWENPGIAGSATTDSVYLALDPPYRAALGPLADESELGLVSGVTPGLMTQLGPSLIALPVTLGPTGVNVNTASAKVLAALFPNLSTQVIADLVGGRAQTPFATATALMARLPAGTPPPGVPYGVRSAYYEVHVQTTFGRLTHRAVGLIYRPLGGVKATLLWLSRDES